MSLYENDFTARMQAGRDAAASKRYKGLTTGKAAKGWIAAAPAPIEDTEEARAYREAADLRSQLAEANNVIARIKATGAVDPADEWAREFDELVGRGRQAAPLVTAPHTQARKDTRGSTMTAENTSKDDDARRVAREMLMEGEASPSEVAQLAGASRQLVAHWSRDINWRKARKAALTRSWRARMKASRAASRSGQ